MTKKYDNPPLVEAVFELFHQGSKWNPAIPGLFYNKVKDDYPDISQNSGGIGFNIGGQGIQIASGNGELIRYLNKDKNNIMQLSQNLFTVNRLPKYDSWESFSKTIMKNVDIFYSIIAPQVINRIGLKTLNKIDLGEKRSLEKFKELFKIYPKIGYPKDNNLNSLNLLIEIPIEENEILSIVTATLVGDAKMKNPILFQLLYSKLIPTPTVEINNWIEKAHDVLHQAFEENLTDECKLKFN